MIPIDDEARLERVLNSLLRQWRRVDLPAALEQIQTQNVVDDQTMMAVTANAAALLYVAYVVESLTPDAERALVQLKGALLEFSGAMQDLHHHAARRGAARYVHVLGQAIQRYQEALDFFRVIVQQCSPEYLEVLHVCGI